MLVTVAIQEFPNHKYSVHHTREPSQGFDNQRAAKKKKGKGPGASLLRRC